MLGAFGNKALEILARNPVRPSLTLALLPIEPGSVAAYTPGMLLLRGLMTAAMNAATATHMNPSTAKNSECGQRVQ